MQKKKSIKFCRISSRFSSHPPAGELQEVPRPVEAARGKDVRAGAGEGRDPHESPLVSPRRLTSIFSFPLSVIPHVTQQRLDVAPPTG